MKLINSSGVHYSECDVNNKERYKGLVGYCTHNAFQILPYVYNPLKIYKNMECKMVADAKLKGLINSSMLVFSMIPANCYIARQPIRWVGVT